MPYSQYLDNAISLLAVIAVVFQSVKKYCNGILCPCGTPTHFFIGGLVVVTTNQVRDVVGGCFVFVCKLPIIPLISKQLGYNNKKESFVSRRLSLNRMFVYI